MEKEMLLYHESLSEKGAALDLFELCTLD